MRAAHEGYLASVAFVIQMDGVAEVRPNMQTHPEFGIALEEAEKTDVRVLFLPCHVESDSICVADSIVSWR
jgi:sugar fermentation stimulation protein A